MDLIREDIVMKKNILFVGHSFVRRIYNMNLDFNLCPVRTELRFCGHVGYSTLNFMEQINENINWILNVYGIPEVVVLFIDSNDILYHFDKTPRYLAD